MLEPTGIRNWRARRRPALTEAIVKKRYNWCKAREHWTLASGENICGVMSVLQSGAKADLRNGSSV